MICHRTQLKTQDAIAILISSAWPQLYLLCNPLCKSHVGLDVLHFLLGSFVCDLAFDAVVFYFACDLSFWVLVRDLLFGIVRSGMWTVILLLPWVCLPG